MRVEQKRMRGDGRRRAQRDQNRGRGDEKKILEWKEKADRRDNPPRRHGELLLISLSMLFPLPLFHSFTSLLCPFSPHLFSPPHPPSSPPLTVVCLFSLSLLTLYSLLSAASL